MTEGTGYQQQGLMDLNEIKPVPAQKPAPVAALAAAPTFSWDYPSAAEETQKHLPPRPQQQEQEVQQMGGYDQFNGPPSLVNWNPQTVAEQAHSSHHHQAPSPVVQPTTNANYHQQHHFLPASSAAFPYEQPPRGQTVVRHVTNPGRVVRQPLVTMANPLMPSFAAEVSVPPAKYVARTSAAAAAVVAAAGIDPPPSVMVPNNPTIPTSRPSTEQEPAYGKVDQDAKEEDDRSKTVKEEMFPKDKLSELQKDMDKSGDRAYLGLEYLIEIQHNTTKKTQPNYSCLLCDASITIKGKDTKNKLSSLLLAKALPMESLNMLKRCKHSVEGISLMLFSESYFSQRASTIITRGKKADYQLSKFFPTIKERKLDMKNSPSQLELNEVIDKIVKKFGSMKVKLVVGQKLFKRKLPEIKIMVENSTHFKEDREIVEDLLGKEAAQSVFCPSSRSIIDNYADAFEELEREEKELSSKRDRSPGTRSRHKDKGGTSKHRDLDSLPLAGTNPDSARVVEEEIVLSSSEDEESSFHKKDSSGRRQPSHSMEREQSKSRETERQRYRDRQKARTLQRSRSRSSREKRHFSSRDRFHQRRSRSRSSARDRRRRSRSSSRDRKRRSSSNSRDRRRRSSRSTSRDIRHSSSEAEKGTDRRVLLFLKDEETMIERLENEKRPFMQDSQKHPDYEREWGRFYSLKCRAFGTNNVHPELIHDEWVDVWKTYFFNQYKCKQREETNMLLNRHRLNWKDLQEFERNYPQLVRSREERIPAGMRYRRGALQESLRPGERRREKSPQHGQSPKGLAEGRPHRRTQRQSPPDFCEDRVLKDQDEKEGSPALSRLQRGRESLSNPSSASPALSNLNGPSMEVTVIDTLRLLSALENLLDSVTGLEVNARLGEAHSLEVNKGFGESMSLKDDKVFFKMLTEASECLKAKVACGMVQGKQTEVTRICIDSMAQLMQKSKCEVAEVRQREEGLQESHVSLDHTEIAVKAAIAKTVADQYRQAGRVIETSKLTAIVNAEYARVKNLLPAEVERLNRSNLQDRGMLEYRRFEEASRDVPRMEAAEDSFRRRGGLFNPEPPPSDSGQGSLAIGRYQEQRRPEQERTKRHLSLKPKQGQDMAVAFGSLNVDWSALETAVQSVTADTRSKELSPTSEPVPSEQQSHTQDDCHGQVSEQSARQFQGEQDEFQAHPIRSSQSHFQEGRLESQRQHPRQTSAGCASQQEQDVYDDLTIEDLTSLFKNFKQLDGDTQKNLIAYMKKLEKSNPLKVMELKSHIHKNK